MKCSVSFFETAVTHHYPAQSPDTPPAHKVFAFSAEERARIQKVLNRSKQQDTPVIKVTSPTPSVDSEDANDAVLLQYSRDELPNSQESQVSNESDYTSQPSQDNRPSITTKPCTPLIRLSDSPRKLLAGVTPALPILETCISPMSSTSENSEADLTEMKSQALSTPVKVCLVRAEEEVAKSEQQKSPDSDVSSNSSESELKSQPLVTPVVARIEDIKARSPIKRKSPSSETDDLTCVSKKPNTGSSQPTSTRPTVRARNAIRKVDLSNFDSTPAVDTDSKVTSSDARPTNAKLYDSLFGFASESESSQSSQACGSQVRSSPRSSPRKNKISPPNVEQVYVVNNVTVSTPSRPTEPADRRTPFRMLNFDVSDGKTPIRKPPVDPSSVKKITSIRTGTVSKAKQRLASHMAQSLGSLPRLTPSRSSERLLAKARRNSLTENSDPKTNGLLEKSECHRSNILSSSSNLNPDTHKGSSLTLPNHVSTFNDHTTPKRGLSRSTGNTCLNSVPQSKIVLTVPSSPRSVHHSPTRAVRNSPRRNMPSSPKLPVRSSPRKAQSLTLLPRQLSLFQDAPSSDEESLETGKRPADCNDTVEDTVRRMREVTSLQASTMPQFSGVTTPSEASQVH